MAKIKFDKKVAAIGAGIVAVVVIVIIIVKRKKVPVATEPAAPEPVGDIPSPPYVPDPVINLDPPLAPEPAPAPVTPVPAGPDPLNPSPTPVQGQYYIVKKGDTMIGILKEAGFPKGRLNKAYKAMLNHQKNKWIGTTYEFTQDPADPDNLKEGTEILRLLRHFEPMGGKESLTWAWNTKYRAKASSDWKWPGVYLPADGEVPA